MRVVALFAFAACAAPVAPPVAARPPVPSASSPPLEVVDEVIRFHAPEIPEAAFAVRDDDAIVIAHAEAENKPWSLDALDTHGAPLWARPVDGWFIGVSTFSASRTAVFTRSKDQRDTVITVLDPRGERLATSTFTALTGTACTKPNRYWLARVGDNIVAEVFCATKGTVRVTLDPELRATQVAPHVSYGPMYTPDAYIETRTPDVELVYASQRTPLMPRSPLTTISQPQVAGLDGDVVAMVPDNRARDATLRPRFTERGYVARFGAHPWSTNLVPDALTDSPTTLAGIGATRDGTVLVAAEHGAGARLAGLALPASIPADARFPSFERTLAVAELDGATGSVRRVLALQPRTAWRPSVFASLTATPQHVVVASGDDVVVFARRGRALGPVASPALATPPVPTSLAADPATLRTVAASWQKVCGPRIAQKRNAPCRLEALAIGKDGSIAVGGGYYEQNQLDTVKLPKRAFMTAVVAVFRADGTLRWSATMGTSWHNSANELLFLDDGTLVVLGSHSNHFSIGATKLPERTVTHYADGSVADFEANIPFVAYFDPAGHPTYAQDVDELVFGNTSTDPFRTCKASFAQAAPDELWLRADCADAVRRVRLHGTTASQVEVVPRRPAESWPPSIDSAGRLLNVGVDWTTTSLLVDDIATARSTPVLAGRTLLRYTASTARGTWIAASVPRVTGDAYQQGLQAAFVSPSGEVRAVELGATPDEGRARINGLTVDDQGRPIIAIFYSGAFALGGIAIPEPPAVEGGNKRGELFVRLTADGTAIDKVIIPEPARGSCAHPEFGELQRLEARGNRLAVLYSFGVECGVKDEPTTLSVFDL